MIDFDWQTVVSLWQYDFWRYAVVAGLLIGILAPTVGNFLLLRRYALLVDTLAHVSLLGLAFGLLWHWSPTLSAVLSCLAAAGVIETLRQRGRLGGETVLALIMSTALASAAIILARFGNLNLTIVSYLFGSLLTLDQAQVWLMAGLTLLSLALILWNYRALVEVVFDEELAAATGLKVKYYNYLLLALVALTVGLAIQIVGALLISALVVIPVITARFWSGSLAQNIGLSIILAEAAVLLGLFGSVFLATPPGATIVIVSALGFLGSTLWRRS